MKAQSSPEAPVVAVEALIALGRDQDARTLLEAADNPSDVLSAITSWNLGRSEEALTKIATVGSNAPSLESSILHSWMLLELGRASDAMAPMQRARETEPKDHRVLALSARVAEANNDLDLAQESAGLLADSTPDRPEVHSFLGYLALRGGRWRDAAQEYRRSAKLGLRSY